MRKYQTKSLFTVWLGWTVVIGVIVLAVGLVKGFDSATWKWALFLGGFAEVWLTRTCLRSWAAFAEYRWFWWTR